MTLHLSIPLEVICAAACGVICIAIVIIRSLTMSPNVRALADATANLSNAVAPLPAAIQSLVARLPDAEDGPAIQAVVAQLTSAAEAINQAVAAIPQ